MAYIISRGEYYSDEYHDPFCDQCFDEKGFNIKVYGYCKECCEFLCADCHIVHCRLQGVGSHTMLKGADMPQSEAAKPTKYTFCSMHPEQLEDRFCAVHNTLVCTLCHLSDHQNCSVGSVEDTCKYIPTTEIYTLYDTLYSLKESLHWNITSIYAQTRKLEEQRDSMIKNAQRILDDVIAKAHALYREMTDTIEASYRAQLALLSDNKRILSSIIERLENSLACTEPLKDKVIDTKVFLKAQNTVTIANRCIKDLKDVNQTLSFNSLSLVPGKAVEHFLSSSSTLASVSKSKERADVYLTFPDIMFPECPLQPSSITEEKTVPSQQSKTSFVEKDSQPRCSRQNPVENDSQAQSSRQSQSQPGTSRQNPVEKNSQSRSSRQNPVENDSQSGSSLQSRGKSANQLGLSLPAVYTAESGTCNIRIAGDKKICWITGMGMTKRGEILIADRNNDMVKLFANDMEFMSSVFMPEKPWDVAVINNEEAVVSTDKKSLVILDTSSGQLYVNRTISLFYCVRGVTSYNDKLVITSNTNPHSVKLIDMDGRVCWSVSSDINGLKLFKRPEYVSSHIKGRPYIIVTDCGNKTLIFLNGKTGDVISKRQLNWKGPCGVTTDNTGQVYVCYCLTHEIAVLNGNLTKENILMSRSDGLSDHPQAIVYDDTKCQLIVSYNNENNLLSFHKAWY